MDGKFFLGMGAILSGGAYLGGAFDPGDYARVVGASPIEVRAALQDLDIRDAPGEPGTDPSRSGGVAPLFELTEQGNDMVWTVRSGRDVAIRLIAHLEPMDGGTRTRVTTTVERGDAPDDLVPPAFRSVGITSGLFNMVLEDQLDDLTRPPSPDPEACRELSLKLLEASAPPPDQQIGFAGVARTALTLSAVEGKLKAAGCDTGFQKFREVSNEMGSDPGPSARSGPQFDPSKPMVDVRPSSMR
jgi:hypothetical protein